MNDRQQRPRLTSGALLWWRCAISLLTLLLSLAASLAALPPAAKTARASGPVGNGSVWVGCDCGPFRIDRINPGTMTAP